MYIFMPFVLLAIINILLIFVTVRSMRKFDKSDREKARFRQMSVTLIISITSFLVFNVPNAIVGNIMLKYFYGTYYSYLTLTIALFNRAIHFFYLYTSNTIFSNQVKEVLRDLKIFKSGRDNLIVRSKVVTLTESRTETRR